MKNQNRLRGAAAPIALSIALAAQPAFAQEDTTSVTASESEAAIIVTGSRIMRPEVEGAAPLIASIGEEELERRAFTNVGDALNETPGFGIPVNSVGDQSSYSVGQSFVNLFGIGSQRTLTLVNGRRFVSSNTASNFGGASAGLQVDLNVIPISLVERIDVLAVKGATTYGSDAIAGTVNLILKEDFQGIEATAQYGVSEEGDADNYFGSITMGSNFAENRGNFAINFEYDKQDGVMANARERTSAGYFFGTTRDPASPFATTLYQNRRISAVDENGSPTRAAEGVSALPRFGGFTNANGDIVRFDPNGNLVKFDLGNPDGFVVDAEGGDGFNLNDVSQILSDVERFTAFATAHYDVSDNVTAFVEASYAHINAVELADQPIYNSALFGDKSIGLGMLLSNPLLSDQARQTLLLPGNLADAAGNQVLNFDTDGDGINDDTRFFLQRASTDIVGTSPTRSEMDLFRVVGGLRGDFNVGDRPFNWNVSYAWGQSKSTSYMAQLVQQNFVNAVDVVTDPVTGNPACRVSVDPQSTLDVTGTGAVGINANDNCVPLDLFGQGRPSQAAIDYVMAMTLAESRNTQWIVNANMGGELFDIMGNGVAFNLGYEHRNEKQSFTPDGFQQQGLGRSIPVSPVTGEFNTDEVFGEVLIPLVQPHNDSFIYLMELDGSVRYIDNSRAGSDWVWSVGGRLAPVAGLTLRGSYTQSVRAPSITELFLPEVSIYSFAEDPCDQDYINSGQNPAARAANCAAAGITQPFSSIIDDASQMVRSAGNPELRNERSKSWTVGMVFEPSGIRNLVITADWVNIEIEDAIIDATLTDLMEACYDSPDYPNAESCEFFTRGPNGQITDALTSYVNAATYEFSGLQASLRYSMDAGPGRVGLLARYFYLDKLERDLNGVIDTFEGEIGYSRHEATATLSYDIGGTGIAFTGRYMSGAKYDNEADEFEQNISEVGDYFEADLSLSQTINDRFTIRATVNNLFNAQPPFPLASSVTYNSALLGRRFKIGASVRF